MMQHGYKRSLKAVQRKKSNTAKTKMDPDVIYERFRDTLVVFQSNQKLMGYLFIPRGWKKYICHKGISWNYQSILGHGLIPGGKEKDKYRQAVFLTPTNPFGHDPEEEIATNDFTVPQRVPYITR